jgi:hypothetical protein
MENQSNFNQNVVGYRDKPINPESVSGNFFNLNKSNSNTYKYELVIDNLLSVPDEDIKNKKLPSETLAKTWFKKYNLKEIAKEKNIPYEIFINRIVAKEASKRGYDAIKYGDIILQGVKMEQPKKDVVDEESDGNVSSYILQKIKKKLSNTETKLSPKEFDIAFKKYPEIVDKFVKTKLEGNIWMSLPELKYAKEHFPEEDVVKYNLENNFIKMKDIIEKYPEIAREKLKADMDKPLHVMTDETFQLIKKLFPPEQINKYIEKQLPKIQSFPEEIMEYAFKNFSDIIRDHVIDIIHNDSRIVSPIFLKKLDKYDPDLAKKYADYRNGDNTPKIKMDEGIKSTINILRDLQKRTIISEELQTQPVDRLNSMQPEELLNHINKLKYNPDNLPLQYELSKWDKNLVYDKNKKTWNYDIDMNEGAKMSDLTPEQTQQVDTINSMQPEQLLKKINHLKYNPDNLPLQYELSKWDKNLMYNKDRNFWTLNINSDYL